MQNSFSTSCSNLDYHLIIIRIRSIDCVLNFINPSDLICNFSGKYSLATMIAEILII